MVSKPWWRMVAEYGVKKAIVVESLDGNADADTIEMRKQRCSTCIRNVYGVCKGCSCFIDIKVTTKVNLNKRGEKEITHCPDGKWNDVNIVNFYKSLRNGKKKIKS
jgi:hypothetical protein